MKKTVIAAIAAILFAGTAYSVDESLSKGKNTEIQKSVELDKTEKALDEHIKKLGEMLQRYNKLQNIDVKYTPGQTIFTKGDGYIELISYNFIPTSFSYGKPVGTKEKRLRLFFSGETLTKMETEVMEQDFLRQTKFYSKVVDPSPTDAEVNDITITTSFNDAKAYEVTLKNMENSLTNPLRINYKREYYIDHLTYFEKMYRFTEEFQKHYGTNNDMITIERLKKSLAY